MKKVFRKILVCAITLCTLFGFCTTNVYAEEAESFDLSKTGAEAMYKEYIDTISFIQDDSTWSSLLEGYERQVNVNGFSKIYSECVNSDGKSEEEMVEEYKAMSSFDKFVWVSTYLIMANEAKLGVSNEFKTYDKIKLNHGPIINMIENYNRNDAEKVSEAYDKLLRWQLAYIQEHGSPYCFMRCCSYNEDNGIQDVAVDELKDSSEAKAEEELALLQEETQKALEESGEQVNIEKKNGIGFMPVVIVILLIVIGGMVGYIVKQKKN